MTAAEPIQEHARQFAERLERLQADSKWIFDYWRTQGWAPSEDDE